MEYPISDDDGEFKNKVESARPCKKCGEYAVHSETWTSNAGGFEDWRYTCKACGHFWWVEGPDS
jgi:DNA-directed RNA polymerase subunit M/transcription elongation factor TFIIS